MKSFENKKTKIKIPTDTEGGLKDLGYKDLVVMCMNSPKEGGKGLSSSEIREDIKLLDKFEDLELDKAVELEDSEFNTLKKHVFRMTNWPIRHRDLIDFEDYIKSID